KFLSITYSADGEHLLAGGDSKFICLYSIPDRLLLKRFEITVNLSLEGVQEAHDRRRYLANYSEEAAAAKEDHREALPLPGVRTGIDQSRRWWRPDVRVTCVQFSPTGRQGSFDSQPNDVCCACARVYPNTGAVSLMLPWQRLTIYNLAPFLDAALAFLEDVSTVHVVYCLSECDVESRIASSPVKCPHWRVESDLVLLILRKRVLFSRGTL
uniref:WD_REPEATS_REGION domain-containing protein n=1 Tax=Mesocestoides corti TaxID=53468 RepID=A0A5K3G0B7_MESCO